MSVGVQAVYGLEVGIFQPQRVHIAVHQPDESILATGGEISHRHTGVIAGLQIDAAYQLRDRYLHSRLEEHQRGAFKYRIAGGPGVITDGNQVGFFKFTRFHCLSDDVTGHHLRQTSRVATFVGVLFRQNFAGVVVDQDVGFRIDLRNARDHSFDIQVIGMCG